MPLLLTIRTMIMTRTILTTATTSTRARIISADAKPHSQVVLNDLRIIIF